VRGRHTTIDGNRAHNTTRTTGIILRSWQSVVADLYVTDMGGDGIRVTNLSRNGTKLTSTEVNGRISGSFIEHSGRYGVYVEDTGNAVTDWEVMDNWIASSGVDGIHLDNAAGWVVERDHIYGVPHTAIYANRVFATSISDNDIEDFGGAKTPGTWYGIDATVQGDAASTLTGNRVFNVNGEATPGSTYRYIALSRVNYGSGVCGVTGNVVRGAGTPRGTGLYYATGGGRGVHLTVTSTGNAVVNVQRQEYVSPGVTLGRGL